MASIPKGTVPSKLRHHRRESRAGVDAVSVVEIAAEKGAATILMPVASRKQLLDLSDSLATKVNVLFYGDAREALLKGMLE